MVDLAKIERLQELMSERKKINSEIYSIIGNEPKFEDISVVFAVLTSLDIERDVKLFVLLYIYTPEVLAGQYMRRGIRWLLAILFGYRSGSAISVRARDLLFRYRTYKDFRTEVDAAMQKTDDFLKRFNVMDD